jgi:SAM-dependent methyltransferase
MIYGAVIFSSAFLLFLVQPLIAKLILPWFGGVGQVWAVCLVFFQTVLLLGYLYAHLLARKFRPRAQGRIHAALLAASLLWLPILPKAAWQPSGREDPATYILWLLALTIGLPFFALSTTSPLLQAWYARSRGTSPYRFYALSNVGSLLALVVYPILVEPKVSSSHQAIGWSAIYVIVIVFCGALGLALGRQANSAGSHSPVNGAAPNAQLKLLWLSLAACGSALLLAITNHITQDVASVPFLWVIPLGLYLLSFILCFEGRGWYRRGLFLRLLGLALGTMAYALSPAYSGLPLSVLLPLYCLGLFVCCMFCHGELARLKPDPAHLTSFYLMLSLGGAIGAALVALVAPRVFSDFYELEIALGACAVLLYVVHRNDTEGPFRRTGSPLARAGLAALIALFLVGLGFTIRSRKEQDRLSVRNFYGVLRVTDVTPPPAAAGAAAAPISPLQGRYRRLVNGAIEHGLQFLAAGRRDLPTSYYGPDSGIGVALRALEGKRPLRVGVIGLGTGTIAIYGREGDHYTFYEINPLDIQLAHSEFTFLHDSPATIRVVQGDARLSLEHEPLQGFDVLAVDAFTGDSIPVHLLTLQALELYFRQLQPQGVLAVHISNRYLNLEPVVEAAAARLGKEAVEIGNPNDHPKGIFESFWILVGSRHGFLSQSAIERAGSVLSPSKRNILWTDDYSSLFRLVK